MRVGAELRSCGDAVSTAAIWGSDCGLVFLLHNQFAVWIPLHEALSIHFSPDPAKSLSLLFPLHQCDFIFFPPVSLFVWFTITPEKKIQSLILKCYNKPKLKAVQNSLLSFLFCSPLQNFPPLQNYAPNCVSYSTSHSSSSTNCILWQCRDFGSNYISQSVCEGGGM